MSHIQKRAKTTHNKMQIKTEPNTSKDTINTQSTLSNDTTSTTQQLIDDTTTNNPESLVLSYIQSLHDNTVTQTDLLQVMTQQYNITKQVIVDIINKLLSNQRISIYTRNDNSICYKYNSDIEQQKLSDLSFDDNMIYNIIISSGTSGIWSRDIKYKTKISQITLNKILKHLLNKQLIKYTHSIEQYNRKIYYGYDIIINNNKQQIGQSWYVNGEYDNEYVQLIEKSIILICNNNKHTSLNIQQILNEIDKLNLFTSLPEQHDLTLLCNALCIDNILKHVDNNKYTIQQSSIDSALNVVPCWTCAVQVKCTLKNNMLINPVNCVYYTKWLEF